MTDGGRPSAIVVVVMLDAVKVLPTETTDRQSVRARAREREREKSGIVTASTRGMAC